MRCSLLAALLAVFASQILAEPVSDNDQFRFIAAHKAKAAEDPICCLRPVEADQDDGELLSFEDWKAKRLAAPDERNATIVANGNGAATKSTGDDGPEAPSPPAPPAQDVTDPYSEHAHQVAPHFLIPITDRFNYAGADCSARVHMAHKGAKSAASVLSGKKDRYMLTPCNAHDQFVLVELCDDIRIDTVQLANFEFFSGVFKDFTVSVAKQYTTKREGWTVAGTYRAKNVRGVQSFHPPTTLRDFYRYIRIDFHSHYGNEYYCPLSLLRVYGLTHLEEWKWEVWQEESRRVEAAAPALASAVAASEADTPSVSAPDANTTDSPDTSPAASETPAETSTYSPMTPPTTSTEDARGPPPTPTDAPSTSDRTITATSITKDAVSPPVESPQLEPTPPPSAADAEPSTNTTSTPAQDTADTPPSSSVHTIVPSALSPPIVPSGGESIYRTILNRVSALEANTSLYARYAEDQIGSMRALLRRLAEDAGRLEGVGRAQARAHARALTELEKERRELVERIAALREEVVLEKRLGIAQLCLLLAVLVFMGLTRGSRGDDYRRTGPALRELGRRTLSFGPRDWVSRLRTRSLSLQNTAPAPLKDGPPIDEPGKVPFPKPKPKPAPLLTHLHPARHPHRPTTPTRARPPTTPTRARPPMQRANSHGAAAAPFGGPTPRSAKRWARSAHLHPVSARVHEDKENGVQEDKAHVPDVFKVPAGAGTGGGGREQSRLRGEIRVLEGEGDADSSAWVDTESEADPEPWSAGSFAVTG